jgi:hypothetical protein
MTREKIVFIATCVRDRTTKGATSPEWGAGRSNCRSFAVNIKTVEEHLRGVGPLDSTRQVPGLVPMEYREVRYVEHGGEEPFETFFRRLVRHVNPPVMKDGGAITEGCTLTVPTKRRFCALSYRGDIAGWRQQVAQGAAALGVTLGELVDGVLVLDDGTSYRLEDCHIEFD